MGHGVSIHKVFIKTDFQLPTGVDQAEANVPGIRPELRFGSTGYFSFNDVSSQILFAKIIMYWNK